MPTRGPHKPATTRTPGPGCARGELAGRTKALDGFTLIELLVVITIIALLLGLLVTGGMVMMRNTRADNTRMLLKELAGIATDYRSRTGSPADQASNSYGSQNSSTSIEYFVSQVRSNAPDSADLFQKINPRFYAPNGSSGSTLLGFKDSWGHWIRYTNNVDGVNNPPLGGSPANGLPVRIDSSDNPIPYFASAGPDGKWGTIDTTTNKPDADAKDNIYSFELKATPK